MTSKLLVIAKSGRMIAQMVVDAGLTPWVIDCFADVDTRQLAADSLKIASLALADLLPAVERFRQQYGLTHLVYGSGFEAFPDSLAYLHEHWVVLGNSVQVFRQFQDKSAFFQQLHLLNIRFPETLFSPPNDDGDWLLKPTQEEGGVGIVAQTALSDIALDDDTRLGQYYWQRLINGLPMSVTFVASDQNLTILGFNYQWTVTFGEQSFIFAGIANHAELSQRHQQLLQGWLERLVEAYALKGLGSLDFILSSDDCYVLELNARIPASAQLYASAFNRHIQACLGAKEIMPIETKAEAAAYLIIYAPTAVTIHESIAWPAWAVDRPDPGAIIGVGQPICSIIASGNSAAQTSKCLQGRQQMIETILNIGS